jgi:hypothetical protein
VSTQGKPASHVFGVGDQFDVGGAILISPYFETGRHAAQVVGFKASGNGTHQELMGKPVGQKLAEASVACWIARGSPD